MTVSSTQSPSVYIDEEDDQRQHHHGRNHTATMTMTYREPHLGVPSKQMATATAPQIVPPPHPQHPRGISQSDTGCMGVLWEQEIEEMKAENIRMSQLHRDSEGYKQTQSAPQNMNGVEIVYDEDDDASDMYGAADRIGPGSVWSDNEVVMSDGDGIPGGTATGHVPDASL